MRRIKTMKCNICGNDLIIASSKPVSEEGTTKVEIVQKLVCTKTECDNYCGTDLNKPKRVVKTIRTEV